MLSKQSRYCNKHCGCNRCVEVVMKDGLTFSKHLIKIVLPNNIKSLKLCALSFL
jgi:hypothetical protein